MIEVSCAKKNLKFLKISCALAFTVLLFLNFFGDSLLETHLTTLLVLIFVWDSLLTTYLTRSYSFLGQSTDYSHHHMHCLSFNDYLLFSNLTNFLTWTRMNKHILQNNWNVLPLVSIYIFLSNTSQFQFQLSLK